MSWSQIVHFLFHLFDPLLGADWYGNILTALYDLIYANIRYLSLVLVYEELRSIMDSIRIVNTSVIVKSIWLLELLWSSYNFNSLPFIY